MAEEALAFFGAGDNLNRRENPAVSEALAIIQEHARWGTRGLENSGFAPSLRKALSKEAFRPLVQELLLEVGADADLQCHQTKTWRRPSPTSPGRTRTGAGTWARGSFCTSFSWLRRGRRAGSEVAAYIKFISAAPLPPPSKSSRFFSPQQE